MYNALVMFQKESRDILPVNHQEYMYLKTVQNYNREVNEMREQNKITVREDNLDSFSYHQLYNHLKETM